MGVGETSGLMSGRKSSYGSNDISRDVVEPRFGSLSDAEVSVSCWSCCRRQNGYVDIDDHVPGDHCHQPRESGINRKAIKQLLVATVLCFCFMITEAIGGYISNSIAVLTDAAHLGTDLFAFIVSLGALVVAARAPSKSMSFGWKRAEVIGAIISVLLIWVITAILVDLAVDRLLNPNYKINGPVMVGTSVAGIVINIIMGCALNQDSVGKDEKVNINVRAAFIHVLGDLLQSIGVFSAALTIYMRPEWIIADPICTFIFSVIVFCTTLGVLKDAIHVLLAATPPELDLLEINASLLALPGVVGLHALHVWALSMDSNVIMAHLEVNSRADHDGMVEKATELLRNKFRFYEICVQVELYKVGMDNCLICNENKDLITRSDLAAV